MTYSYFPGCTLKNKAKDLDHYARECAKVLGFELEEIENWQCCGAVYPQASDEIATKLSSVRALADAKEKGQDLIPFQLLGRTTFAVHEVINTTEFLVPTILQHFQSCVLSLCYQFRTVQTLA